MSDNSVMESQRLSFDSFPANMFFVFVIFLFHTKHIEILRKQYLEELM